MVEAAGVAVAGVPGSGSGRGVSRAVPASALGQGAGSVAVVAVWVGGPAGASVGALVEVVVAAGVVVALGGVVGVVEAVVGVVGGSASTVEARLVWAPGLWGHHAPRQRSECFSPH